MSAPICADPQAADLEALDFQPKCVGTEPDDCPDPAVWALTIRCRRCRELITWLCCERHHETAHALLARRSWAHRNCGAVGDIVVIVSDVRL